MNRTLGSLLVNNLNSIAQAATEYTDVFKLERCTGTGSVLVVSTAGSITITQEVSDDNINWYAPVDSAGNAVGNVVTTMTVGSKWVNWTPAIARFSRLKIVENNSAATVVTVRVMMQEEN